MIKFLTYRCIEDTRANLFRKKETILYPAYDFYPRPVEVLIHGGNQFTHELNYAMC